MNTELKYPRDRAAILNLLGHTCAACGATGKDVHIDHIKPVRFGGINALSNMQPLCRSCNGRKAGMTIDFRYEKHEWFFDDSKRLCTADGTRLFRHILDDGRRLCDFCFSQLDNPVRVCDNPAIPEEEPMPKKKPQDYVKPRCPKCGSGQVQYRKTDNKRWCRICSHEGSAAAFLPKTVAA
jgi:hypothetical protein